ncbi:MAG TPA: helix-turn-helix domain-containing protein [Roseiflexaceae bacterium]
MSDMTALPRLLYRPKEAAEILAMSERELWRKTKNGEIPSIGRRRLRRYADDDLREYIRRNRNGGGNA